MRSTIGDAFGQGVKVSPGQAPLPVLPNQYTDLLPIAQELFGKEGIALAVGIQRLAHPRAEAPAERVRGQLFDFWFVQPPQVKAVSILRRVNSIRACWRPGLSSPSPGR